MRQTCSVDLALLTVGRCDTIMVHDAHRLRAVMCALRLIYYITPAMKPLKSVFHAGYNNRTAQAHVCTVCTNAAGEDTCICKELPPSQRKVAIMRVKPNDVLGR